MTIFAGFISLAIAIGLAYWSYKKINKRVWKITVYVLAGLFLISGATSIFNPRGVEKQQAAAEKKESHDKAKVASESRKQAKVVSESKKESQSESESKKVSESKKTATTKKSEPKKSGETSNHKKSATKKTSTKSVNQKSATNKKSTKIVTDSNKSIKQALKKYAPSVKVKSVNGSYIGHDDTTQIVITGQENLTDKMTVKGMYLDIASVWKAFKKTDTSKLSNIGVSVKYPLTDEGGNSTKEYVIKSDITPTKLEMLNAEGFDSNNVPTFSTEWWQHSALPEIN